MFHYKSLFTDEVGAIRQRGPGKKRESSEGQKQSARASQSGVASCQSPPENGSSSATVFLGLVWQRQYVLS